MTHALSVGDDVGGRAGGSSKQKYDDLTRRWRRLNRRVFVFVGAVCAAVFVGMLVLSFVLPMFAFACGVLAGVALAFFVSARLSPPGWIEHWQEGAWGEESTAKALRPLEDAGWVVMHDLSTGDGNVDHIAVGPQGVFLLDSKRPNGTARIDGDGAFVVTRFGEHRLGYRRYGPPHAVALARQTHDRMLRSTRISVWVSPVMVVWGDFPQRVVEGRCPVVHGDELVAWLRSQPVRIAPERVERIAQAARRAWTEQRPPDPAA